MHEAFADRVAAAVAGTGPLCAGIDPSVTLLRQWGLTEDAEGVRQFGIACVHAFAGVAAAVKPQVAFFERWGSAGMAALESVMAEARAEGLLVIADAKRGDIGTTSAAYAGAWLDPDSPLAADAVTALPYMGMGALRPMIELAAAGGRGVIVVVRSSNPDGRALQEALTDSGSGPSVEDMLLAEAAAWNAQPSSRGAVGVVVGATLQPSRFPLHRVGGVILSPGVGAQGATGDDLAALFGECPPGSVLANVSRSLLAAGPDVDDLRAAAVTATEDMAAALR
jgi:orotidine-5'-phosphate decarboxylase